jgi:predicted  nucleic acid-binding Zn-ribbon protein
VYVQEPIKLLLALQDRDLELEKLQAILKSIPREIAAIRAQIDADKKALEESKKELIQAQLQRKEKEVDLETKEGEIRKHTAELNSIKSNDAYRAMMGEIDKSKEGKSQLEDAILQLMDKVDQANRAWKERESAAKASEGGRLQQIQDLEAKQKSSEEQQAQKQKERDELAASYGPKVTAGYERQRKGKSGAVIVPIRGEQCAGCHMRVSPNLVNEIKRGQTVNYCEHCQRIVYLEEVATQ